ncbi:MAG: TIGR01548 family HAD-type hydrolase [Gloeomargarita sp. SKYB31]|nr:TIGR01548 family HAD-type hydrolase [Gloeomargarita sp. SKYB31]
MGALICDVDGVIRDVRHSYRRAIQATVAHFSQGCYQPSLADIDRLKSEGYWNNDWEATQELLRRWGVHVPLTEITKYFQSLYWGPTAEPTGFITQEHLLITASYFCCWENQGWQWGFFSGAPRREVEYALLRLGITDAPLVAMEDAPGKPDPTGLFMLLHRRNCAPGAVVVYVGDTVADMLTVQQARAQKPEYTWIAIGILPPHVQDIDAYRETLLHHGAHVVLPGLCHLTPQICASLAGWNE